MGKRKTVDVRALVEKVNHRNKHSTCSRAVRDGWNTFIEDILMETGNYNGFGYYLTSEVPEGCLPGMVNGESEKTFPDDSRRYYYFKG